MTVIEPISHDQMQDLISANVWGKITGSDSEKLQDVLSFTTSMWGGWVDGKLLCVYGVAAPTFFSDRAYFWVWVTDHVQDHEFIFVRRSQMVVKGLLEHYRTLFGHCERGADRSKRWLKWLGAEFAKAEGDMIPFEIRRS